MLEKGLIKNGNRKKKGKKAKKKKMEPDKTCAMSQIKTYVKIIQVTNPLDLHTSLNSGPYAFWRFSISL